MTQRISAEKPPRQRPERRIAGEAKPAKNSPSIRKNHSSFSDHMAEHRIAPAKQQRVRRVPSAAKRSWMIAAQRMLLSRALSWLRGGSVPGKRLRVLETASLGEKRLVAIIQADGGRFLVGCGATGVSLLTRLDQTQNSVSAPDPVVAFVGPAECR